VATRTVQAGQRVAPGQALMRVVPLAGAYIEANFKETQLGKVRIGQPATVVADIYPDHVYHAVVDSLAPGTGAAFALLPPENATGNWIKVVQRLPVRVRLTETPPADRPLRVGLSVVVTIDVSRTEGALLVPRGAAK
jgi:membrane fusion protein (multidrug efflux system)